MSQHDYVIDDAAGATVRGDINNVLAAIVSLNSGATEPSDTFAYMWWLDTTLGVLKQRNAADDAWVIRDTAGDDRVPVNKTGTYVVVAADYGKLINGDATGGDFDIDLTAAATLGNGFVVAIKSVGTGNVTIDPNAVETIDGVTTKVLGTQYDAVLLRSDGSDWHIEAQVTAADAGAPNPSHAGYASNLYYPSLLPAYNTTGAAVTADILYLTVFLVGVTHTFTRIGVEVTSSVAGAARLGIYNFTDGLPGTLVLDAGTIDTGSTGVKEVTISQALQPGWYFLAIVFNAAPSIRFATAATTFMPMLSWGFDGAPGGIGEWINRSFTYAALPTPFGTPSYNTGNGPLIHLRDV